jgi:hypothetical protein
MNDEFFGENGNGLVEVLSQNLPGEIRECFENVSQYC